MTDRIPASPDRQPCCRLCGGPLTEKGNCARSVEAMRQAASPAETTPIEELVDALRTLNVGESVRQSLIDAYKKREEVWKQHIARTVADLSSEVVRQDAELRRLRALVLTAEEWDQVRVARIWDDPERDALLEKIYALRRIANGETEK